MAPIPSSLTLRSTKRTHFRPKCSIMRGLCPATKEIDLFMLVEGNLLWVMDMAVGHAMESHGSSQ